QGLVDHLADRAQRVLGRNPLLEVDVAEHRVLLLLVSTHATYITYLPVERLVPSQVPATFSVASLAAEGLRRLDHLLPGLKSVCENVCRPYGTRIYFPLYPALRLRLRAGLDYSAPTALDFPLGDSTRKRQVWFSHTLLSPFLLHLLTAQLKLRPFKTRRAALLLSAGTGGL